ncbi:MAG: hypothetical protein HYZ17_04110 [Betaproteobacteria bacterium]|nr:hypothetical protein [Betaproteobacteria bacterium]
MSRSVLERARGVYHAQFFQTCLEHERSHPSKRRPDLVDDLLGHGVDHIFAVRGASHLAVLDALSDAQEKIRLVICRQEGGAANMAEAYGKLAGHPGICFVTRGPGATNASSGVHSVWGTSSVSRTENFAASCWPAGVRCKRFTARLTIRSA